MYSLLFKYGAIALINKTTQVAKNVTIIDNIITTYIFNESLKKSMKRSDLSDHLLVFFNWHLDIFLMKITWLLSQIKQLKLNRIA